MFANNLGAKPQSPKMELLAKINKPGNLMSKECIVPISQVFYTDSMVVRGRFEVLSIALYGRIAKKTELLRKPFELKEMERKLEEKRRRSSGLMPLSDLLDGTPFKLEPSRSAKERIAPAKQSTLHEFVKENSLFDEINSNLLSVFQQLVDPASDVFASTPKPSSVGDGPALKVIELQNTLVSEFTRLYKVKSYPN